MATRVYKTKDISLQDDTAVTLKPLAIGRLRRFMDAWSKFAEAKNDSDGFDVFVNCAGIALEDNYRDDERFPTLTASAAESKKGEVLSPQYKTYLEEILDLDTIYEVLDICGGIKLTDPKIQEAAAALAEEPQE